MKILIIACLVLLSFSSFAQKVETKTEKIDTVSTTIMIGANNLLRFQQLDKAQKRYDSLLNVQRNELLDVILSSHGLELKNLLKIEPKENGSITFKTKKK